MITMKTSKRYKAFAPGMIDIEKAVIFYIYTFLMQILFKPFLCWRQLHAYRQPRYLPILINISLLSTRIDFNYLSNLCG